MSAPAREHRFWLALSRNGQRLMEELNTDLENLSIPLSKCVVSEVEGESIDLIVSKDAYPNGAHIYVRGKARYSTSHHLEAIRDDVHNFCRDDPRIATRVNSYWKFHLDDWVFGQTEVIWILVVALTETGAYDGRGRSKGFLVRAQPRSWQIASADAELNSLLRNITSFTIEDNDDDHRTTAEVPLSLPSAAEDPSASALAAASIPPLLANIVTPTQATPPPAAATVQNPAPPQAVTQSPATVQYDPFAYARRAPAFINRPRASVSRSVQPDESTTSATRGVKRTQHGSQRPAASFTPAHPIADGGPSPHRQTQDQLQGNRRQERQETSQRNDREKSSADHDRPRHTLPSRQLQKSRAVDGPPRDPSPARQGRGTSSAAEAAPSEPISDRRREKSRAVDPQPLDTIVNESRHLPSHIALASDDSAGSSQETVVNTTRARSSRPMIVESDESDSEFQVMNVNKARNSITGVSYDSDSSPHVDSHAITVDSDDSQDDTPPVPSKRTTPATSVDEDYVESHRGRGTASPSPRRGSERIRMLQMRRSSSVESERDRFRAQRREPSDEIKELLKAFLKLHDAPFSFELRYKPTVATLEPPSDDECTCEDEEMEERVTVEVERIPDYVKALMGCVEEVEPLDIVPLKQKDHDDIPPPTPQQRPSSRIGKKGGKKTVKKPAKKYNSKMPPGMVTEMRFEGTEIQQRWERYHYWRQKEEEDKEKKRKQVEKARLVPRKKRSQLKIKA